MTRIAAAVAVLLLTIAVGTAWAARPPADAGYTGKTSQGRTIKLQVTSDRKGLQMDFRETLSCNRGPDKDSAAKYAEQRPSIRADGTFSYAKRYDLGPVPGFEEQHTQRQRITGSFASAGKIVKGRISDTVTGRSGKVCKVSMTFRATRR